MFGGRTKKRRGKEAIVATTVEPTGALFASEPGPPVAAKSGLLPRFKVSAADHFDRRRADRFTAIRLKLRSAFTPSQPVVDPRMFAGRGELLQHMIGSLEDQKLHLVLYGQRGIGKTSLLHMLADAARGARYIVHCASCGATSNFEETFRAAAQDIPLLFHSGFGPTTEESEGGSTFADLLPAGEFSPRHFGELCARLTGTRVLIILDEFDRTDSPDFRRELAELMKTLSDRTVRVQLVIAGVAADLADLIEHIPSIRRNIQAVRVPQMTDAEIREFIATGESATGLTFERAARDLVARIACGSPYFVSLICHHAALAAIDDNRSTVRAGDVAVAVEQSLRELRDRIGKPREAEIESLMSDGLGGLLTVIAGASLIAGGEFDAREIDAVSSNAVEATAAKRLIEQLAAKNLIFTRLGDGQGKYQPLEDGLAPYLWFRGVLEDFQDTQSASSESA
jgi:Cdc6-like AAA superfamily ATPase